MQFDSVQLYVCDYTFITNKQVHLEKYKNTNRTEDSGAPGESGTVILPTSVASSDDEIIPILMASSTS